MKIAIATENNQVSGHFGHCEGFTMYDVDGTKHGDGQFIANPGHEPGYLPKFIKEKGADLVITGGMGSRAQDLFAEQNIKVVVGAAGSCDNVIDEYLNGQLKSNGNVCNEHKYEGEC